MANLDVKASGISYIGNAPAADTSTSAPFAVSGAGFNSPRDGFSVGFWYAQRDAPASILDSALIVSYGKVPGAFNDNTNVSAGWAVYVDDNANIKIGISIDGTLNLEPDVAASTGNIRCGLERSSVDATPDFIDNFRRGQTLPGHIDAWNHFAWTYDPSGSGVVKCYFNGGLVDQRDMLGQKPNQPDFHGRIMSIFGGLVGDWDWTDDDILDEHGALTDLFYFSRILTEKEVKYIAYHGIAAAPVATVASGLIGGYIAGQNTASGLLGGYIRGQTDASGIIGGYIVGSTASSGFIGGYVSGINPPASGLLGGYIAGSTAGSGLLGGLILGSQTASGLLGGYILGGLSGNLEFDGIFNVAVITAQDYDAITQILQVNNEDFDAKVVVFEDECQPIIDIQVPVNNISGLAPPFNQYFIGKASGVQNKTITKTRWRFGDFTPPVEVSESGAGCYPIIHTFAQSGFYIVKFEAIDSDGIHASATRIINAASGISPVFIALSGIPQAGNAALTVDFTTTIASTPPGVSILTRLLDFDDGQTTIALNPTHTYNELGVYNPIWCVRDSRGITWCDSLDAGVDLLTSGGD
jgi:hypothetical protein